MRRRRPRGPRAALASPVNSTRRRHQAGRDGEGESKDTLPPAPSFLAPKTINLMRSAFQANKNPKSLAELVNWSRDVGKMDKQDAQSFFKFSINSLDLL